MAIDMMAFVNREGEPCLRIRKERYMVVAEGRESVEALFSETIGKLTDEWWEKHGKPSGRIPFAPDRDIHYVDVTKVAKED